MVQKIRALQKWSEILKIHQIGFLSSYNYWQIISRLQEWFYLYKSGYSRFCDIIKCWIASSSSLLMAVAIHTWILLLLKFKLEFQPCVQFFFSASHELTMLVPQSHNLKINCCVRIAWLKITENRISINLYCKKHVSGIQQLTQIVKVDSYN